MSLKTRIHGFTAWVNLRLKPYDILMNNVIMDLLTGTNLKLLVESMTGREMKNVKSFDGLTQQQKITRAEWVVKELKACKLVPEDVYVDARLFAMRGADQVFDLLWRLVSHDIWFVWERAEYLQHAEDQVLVAVPFKWTPEPPPKKRKKTKVKQSLLSGFGAASLVQEDLNDDAPDPNEYYDPFPGSDIMKQLKPKKIDPKNYPAPDDCILEMVNAHLNMSKDGKKLKCISVDDLMDSRVLCALVNSFVQDTFTPEVLLNDRWTMNLCLRTAEKMFYTETPFDSEDLAEGDPMAVCAYFAFFFMVGYKFRQAKAVVNRIEWLHRLIRENNHEMDELATVATNIQELRRKKDLKQKLQMYNDEIGRIQDMFDLEYCRKWLDHAIKVQKETHKLIWTKMKEKFETLPVPRNISINDLCLSLSINLSLTFGSAFYLSNNKEQVNELRKMILRNKETGEYIEDFTAKNKEPIRKILRLHAYETVEVNPEKYPQYDIFFESPSRNKRLEAGTEFLYQIFPGTFEQWHKQMFRAIKENEVDSVKKMVLFFRNTPSFINAREKTTGNTALHIAARFGQYEIVQFLLESNANIDARNAYKYTPLFSALEGVHRRVGHLLVECGCDVNKRSIKGLTAFETVKNDELKDYLIEAYEHYSDVVPKIMAGDLEVLEEVVKDHITGVRQLNSLRSRCVNGSTLIHTAAYFGAVSIVKTLLTLRMDVDLRDYKGATPLHRSQNVETMEVLLEAGASVNAEDLEGNTPLHVKCYGETGKETQLGCIELLCQSGSKLVSRNNRGLMPIHCCAMQGRIDAIQLLLAADKKEEIKKDLSKEDPKLPPSLPHLAVANDCMECAEWLIENGFEFKEGEPDLLVQRILAEQVKVIQQGEAIKFLLDHGASANPVYPGGNTALHYAASMSHSTEILELLMGYGAEVDAPNEDQATPLFFSTQCNNQSAASVLIENGANYRWKNAQGLTAFDCILDFDDWVECGYFNDEIRARLKAYSLKHTRDLIRAISKKVKHSGPIRQPPRTPDLTRQASNLSGQTLLPISGGSNALWSAKTSASATTPAASPRQITSQLSLRSQSSPGLLPPLKSAGSAAVKSAGS
ncbi:uncharacterized protein LOC106164510 [Lingula anatina]|uniref:Uncharacterized protein LOC106164510 n=1 Tax=Lingula anatina TaxID=7574 RepID=A0A1S3II61_LINAN|nr:uncharacterized protein LOC106164510 [Lingula anatina]|eukprot:XP_013397902.1 uncharacterized protein LOC106164510 [Lingula anatina]